MMPGRVMTTDHDDMMASNDVSLFACLVLALALSCFIMQKLNIPVYIALKQTNRQNYCNLNQHRIYNCIVSEYSPCPPFPFPRISAGW